MFSGVCSVMSDFCSPLDCSPPSSSVHEIFQAKILEWVAIYFFPGHLPNPGIEPTSLTSPALASGFFTTSATWEVLAWLPKMSCVFLFPDCILSLDLFSYPYALNKRCLLLGRKPMTNLDSILKSRDITLLTKVCLVKALAFPLVMNGYER